MSKLLKKILDKLPSYTIYNDEGEPYLKRIYITPNHAWWRKRLPGVFLHFFFRSDSDRELHSHPWVWSTSVILTGGYTE